MATCSVGVAGVNHTTVSTDYDHTDTAHDGETPVAAIVLTGPTASAGDETNSADAAMGIGFWDGTTKSHHENTWNDGSGNQGSTFATPNQCGGNLDPGTTTDQNRVQPTSFITDGVRLESDLNGTDYWCIGITFGGTDTTAKLINFTKEAATSTQSLNHGLGKKNVLAFFAGTLMTAFPSSSASRTNITFGCAYIKNADLGASATVTNACYCYASDDNVTTGDIFGYLSDDHCGALTSAAITSATVDEITVIADSGTDTNNISLQSNKGSNLYKFSALCIGLPDDVDAWVGNITSWSGTDQTPTFTPSISFTNDIQAMGFSTSRISEVDVIKRSGEINEFFLGAMSSSGAGTSIGVALRDGATGGTADSIYSSSAPVFARHYAGTNQHKTTAANITFSNDGFTATSTAGSTGDYFLGWAVETPPAAAAGGVPSGLSLLGVGT